MHEEIDVGMKCVKYMLFTANFMFVMIGFLLVSIGTTVKAIYGDFEVFMSDHYYSPSNLVVAIGVIIFIVAIFGCIGAIRESVLLINLFAFFLTLLLVMEFSAAVAAYSMRGQIGNRIHDKMASTIKSYYNHSDDKRMWDFAQSRLGCCGIDGPADWEGIPENFDGLVALDSPLSTQSSATQSSETQSSATQSSETQSSATQSSATQSPETQSPATNSPATPSVETQSTKGQKPSTHSLTTWTPQWAGPSSCCHLSPKGDEVDSCEADDIYKRGCADEVYYIVSESALLLGCGALAVTFVQLLGIIFAVMLARAVRRIKTQKLIERDQHLQRTYEQMARESDEVPTPVLYTPTYSEA